MTVSDKRGTKIESKLEDLFSRAEAMVSEVIAQRERFAAQQRQWQLKQRRRYELSARIERLDRSIESWIRAPIAFQSTLPQCATALCSLGLLRQTAIPRSG